MTEDNYLIYIEKTVAAYSVKVKKHLINIFLKEGIAVKNQKMSGQYTLEGTQVIDISEKELTEQIVSCIHCSKRTRILFEEWEFVKDYKYSAIFTSPDFDSLLNGVLDIKPLEDTCEHEYAHVNFKKPVAYHTDKYSFLKFIMMVSAIHPSTQEELLLKYPFLVVLHKEDKIIEFRFDVLKHAFFYDNNEDTVYADFINRILNYLQSEYNCSIDALDMDFIVNSCKNEEEVKLIAQSMRLSNGGSAQLDVGKSQEYVLPFIGELRALMAENKSELEKVPSVRSALEQFLFEKEEMSDYPWIELLWENEIKTRRIQVKLIFNYVNKPYCLIQHYYNSALNGMERMNYVTKYIIDHRNDDTAKTK